MSSAPSGSGPVNVQTGQLKEIKFTQNKLDFISPVKCHSRLESIVKMQGGGGGGGGGGKVWRREIHVNRSSRQEGVAECHKQAYIVEKAFVA